MRSRVSTMPSWWKASSAARCTRSTSQRARREPGAAARAGPTSHAASANTPSCVGRSQASRPGTNASQSTPAREREQRGGDQPHLGVLVAALGEQRHDLARRAALGVAHRGLDRRERRRVEQLFDPHHHRPEAPPPPKPPPPPEKPAAAEAASAAPAAAAEAAAAPEPPRRGRRRPRSSAEQQPTATGSRARIGAAPATGQPAHREPAGRRLSPRASGAAAPRPAPPP